MNPTTGISRSSRRSALRPDSSWEPVSISTWSTPTLPQGFCARNMPNLVFVRDPRLRTLFGLSLAVLLITLSIMYVRIGTIRGPLIAHFDSYRGIDPPGGRRYFSLLPVVALVLLALDRAWAWALYSRGPHDGKKEDIQA